MWLWPLLLLLFVGIAACMEREWVDGVGSDAVYLLLLLLRWVGGWVGGWVDVPLLKSMKRLRRELEGVPTEGGPAVVVVPVGGGASISMAGVCVW